MLCKFAEYNEFRRLVCTLGEKESPPLCPYQKYCHLSCSWENSAAMNKCTKRSEKMDEKNNKSYYKKPNLSSNKEFEAKAVSLESTDALEAVVEVKESPVEGVTIPVKESLKAKTIKGKVLRTYDNGDIAVRLADGAFVTKYGYFDAKVGDILDFEI